MLSPRLGGGASLPPALSFDFTSFPALFQPLLFPACQSDGQPLEMEGWVCEVLRASAQEAPVPTDWLCHLGQKDEPHFHLVYK